MRFLYYGITELWGHRRIGKAGNGKTGASGKSRAGRKSLAR